MGPTYTKALPWSSTLPTTSSPPVRIPPKSAPPWQDCYPQSRLFPKIFSIGSFYLPTYGVLVALGFLVGLWITVKLARKSGLDAEKITNLAVYVALGGLIGAKLLMIAFDWPDIQ